MSRFFQIIIRGFGWKVGALAAVALLGFVVKALSGWNL